MATLDDLDHEVRRLRKRVNELEGAGSNAQVVPEPIRNDIAGNQPMKRGFAAAVVESTAATLDENTCESVAEPA